VSDDPGAGLPILRVARASSDLARARRFYCDGLGLAPLGAFEDHDGCDGLIVGLEGAARHVELVHERGAALAPPSVEDLIVLYEPAPARHAACVRRMQAAGFAPVRSHNPYWDRHGATFQDPDGYRAVLARLAWPPPRERGTDD
jgi:catechol 2,3-dioxygenase-like lactoylglutathione lyase family enzyme